MRGTPNIEGSYYRLPSGGIGWRGRMPQPDGSTVIVDRVGPSRTVLAQRIAAERKLAMERQHSLDVRTMTVAAYCRWWLENVVKETRSMSRCEAYDLQLSRILPLIGTITVAGLRQAHIEEAIQSMQEARDDGGTMPRWSSATIRRSVEALGNAYSYLVGRESLAKNPISEVELPIDEMHDPVILIPTLIE